MATVDSDQQPLWTPSPEKVQAAEMTRFMSWVGERHDRSFADYGELWRWSVDELEEFWACLWEFCGVRARSPTSRCWRRGRCPGRAGSRGRALNYAENLLLGPRPPPAGERPTDEVAVLHCSELRELDELTWGELRERVAACARACARSAWCAAIAWWRTCRTSPRR